MKKLEKSQELTWGRMTWWSPAVCLYSPEAKSVINVHQEKAAATTTTTTATTTTPATTTTTTTTMMMMMIIKSLWCVGCFNHQHNITKWLEKPTSWHLFHPSSRSEKVLVTLWLKSAGESMGWMDVGASRIYGSQWQDGSQWEVSSIILCHNHVSFGNWKFQKHHSHYSPKDFWSSNVVQWRFVGSIKFSFPNHRPKE